MSAVEPAIAAPAAPGAGSGAVPEAGGSAGQVAPAVETWLGHLAVERGLAGNTLASYRRDLRRYLAYLEARGIDRLSGIAEPVVADFLAGLREGDEDHPPLGASSAARTLVAVRGFHRFAVREGLAVHDPAAAVKPPTAAKRLPKALPLASIEALLAAASAPDTLLALRDRALLELLYGCGARISEAVGLDVDDIDLEAPAGGAEHQPTVLLHGKGGRQRMVPLGSYAVEALRAYTVRARPGLAAAGRGTPALFLNARGGRLSRQSAWTVISQAAGRAGIEADVSPHTLRHSFATHLIDGGADVRVVQELLGHASVTTTQIYTMVTVDRLREVHAASHPRALD